MAQFCIVVDSKFESKKLPLVVGYEARRSRATKLYKCRLDLSTHVYLDELNALSMVIIWLERSSSRMDADYPIM